MLVIYPDGNPSNGNGVYLRPTPLISITQNPLKNKLGKMGSSYDITLNGVIVTNRNSPIDEYGEPINTDPEGYALAEKLPEILARQNQLREYFSNDGLYIEILDINGDLPRLSFYAKPQSVNFEEGTYVDICRYTVNLTADYIIDSQSNVTIDGIEVSSNNYLLPSGDRINTDSFISLIEQSGVVEDFNDTWSVETDETNGSFVNGRFIPRSYRVTRNMTATGRKIFPSPKNAWENARDFIKYHIDSGIYNTSFSSILSSGMLGLPSGYQGYNHIRSENLDKAAGSYAVSDTWLLSSEDSALESYNLSISSSTDAPHVKVSIDGNVKGLSALHASGYFLGSADQPGSITTPYDNALQKYLSISNSGQFGISSDVYKRANNAVAQQLNAQPRSISLGINEVNGEITYNLEFDNRPTNYFSGVLSEAISINDTYPGDVFAIIPVIGRSTGPVLQYIGGRTEYKRDVNIEIKLDYTDLGYNNDRASFMLTKPSVNEPIRSQLNALINDVSPASEPGIRKYFLNPPSENWSPKEGVYGLSLSWVYELDR